MDAAEAAETIELGIRCLLSGLTREVGPQATSDHTTPHRTAPQETMTHSATAGRHAAKTADGEEAMLLQTHDADSFLTFIRRVGIPGDQPLPDPASLDYPAVNNVAGETGQPVLGPPMPAEEARAIITRG